MHAYVAKNYWKNRVNFGRNLLTTKGARVDTGRIPKFIRCDRVVAM